MTDNCSNLQTHKSTHSQSSMTPKRDKLQGARATLIPLREPETEAGAWKPSEGRSAQGTASSATTVPRRIWRPRGSGDGESSPNPTWGAASPGTEAKPTGWEEGNEEDVLEAENVTRGTRPQRQVQKTEIVNISTRIIRYLSP